MGASNTYAGNLDNQIVIERVYEEIPFTVTIQANGILNGATISGIAGLDPISGRIMFDVTSLEAVGMHEQIVGYIKGQDGQRGLDACTLWQSRMFDQKLCYEATANAGSKVIVVYELSR